MHIGAPAKPVVKVGDHVKTGQLIGEPGGFVSAPIHASISGTVKKVDSMLLSNGGSCMAVTIESDGLNEKDENLKAPELTDFDSFIQAVRDSDIVGLGGAGFPTSVKLKVDPAKVDYILINGAECEPYITSDTHTMRDNPQRIRAGLDALKRFFPTSQIYIGIENNKPEAIKVMREYTDKVEKCDVIELPSSYPQGGEKVLIYNTPGRIVPEGKLPLDAGCIVLNATTLSFIGKYLMTGEPGAETITITRIFFVIGVVGVSVKAAMFPLHAWLPKASVAPTPVTALLHAVAVVNAGGFAVLRLTYYGYGTEVILGSWAQYLLQGLATATILYGAARAVKELHWKRRLAYSTVSNLSYILFGAYLMTGQGMTGALLHMAFHGEIKILAFFAAGAVLHHTGREFIDELDGLGRRMKITFACFTAAALGLIGIPPFAGFISKWYILTAAAKENTAASWIGAGSILLAALMTVIYMLTTLRRAYFPGKDTVKPGTEKIKDARWMMLVPMIILALGILLTGLFPGIAIRAAKAAAAAAKAMGGEF